jgi:digeranylgeranylglycerophospholipid reductase
MLELVRLREMQETWISSEINGARFHAPDGTTVDVTSEMFRMEEPLGYVLERKIFDRDLARKAAGAGAHVMVRTRATGLIIEDGADHDIGLSFRFLSRRSLICAID